MSSIKKHPFNLRSIGIMKPEGTPGSSGMAIGVGLFVAFGGILYGYLLSTKQMYSRYLSNTLIVMTLVQSEALSPCVTG